MIQTEQIKEFYSVLNAFEDNGVKLKFAPDMSQVFVDVRPFRFVVNFPYAAFDYKVLSDYINCRLSELKSGAHIKELMSKFNSIDNYGSKIND